MDARLVEAWVSDDEVSDAGDVSVDRCRVRCERDWAVLSAWLVVRLNVLRASSNWAIDVVILSY